VPAITAINKIDVVWMEKLNEICKGMENAVLISALDGSNLDKLREAIWGNLGLMRVYMKRRGKEADMENPVIVKSSSDVKVVCGKIHKDFAKKFKAAKIWGSSKFPGQKVGLDYTLKDGDVVELC
jgi:ribosome-interacting GTPase 1